MHCKLFLSLPSVLLALSAATLAQAPAFDSPGRPSYFLSGQTNRFSREFNPALGFVVDSVFDYQDVESSADGFDLNIRLVELNGSAFIDPDAWAYVAIVAEDLDEIGIEEAAVQYIGLPGNTTFRVGRFFVDFGKQMQSHVEELRTLERPLPLREYLGDELGGTGVQLDHWVAVGEATPVRASLGIFGDLTPEAEADPGDPFAQSFQSLENKDAGELSFTGRLTGMTDVGDSGLFQAGVSARWLPGYEFDLTFDDGMGTTFSSVVPELSEIVYGADFTYQYTGEAGNRTFLVGGEVLVADGDLSATANPGAMTFAVNNDRAVGWFAYGDYGWNPFNSVGVQVARADLRATPNQQRAEIDTYYTRHFTELRRLRLGAIYGDGELEDDWRFYVQFTSFFGIHSHGLNW